MPHPVEKGRKTEHNDSVQRGVGYFFEGAKLMWHPSLRLYCLVPLAINCLLFFIITAAFVAKFSPLVDSIVGWLPDILAPLAWIGIIVVGVLFLIIYGYSFNIITNILAAPFYGRLAEKAEMLLTGKEVPSEPLQTMIPRVIWRELIKIWYFLSRGLIIILLTLFVVFIPVVQVAAPLIGLAWSAWSMSIQYSDYPADNNRLGFKPLRNRLWSCKFSSVGFGAIVMLISTIPVLNIFAMPAAVTGGTVYWVRQLQRNGPA